MGRPISRIYVLVLLVLMSGWLLASTSQGALLRQHKKRPIVVSMGSAAVPEDLSKARVDVGAGRSLGRGSGKSKPISVYQHHHHVGHGGSAYHGAPSGNLDTEELKRRHERLISARQREIQSEMNATVAQMTKTDPEDGAAFRERAFAAAETMQQLQMQTHHLPGMESEQPIKRTKKPFDPTKDPLWKIVMRKKRTGSAYKAKQNIGDEWQ